MGILKKILGTPSAATLSTSISGDYTVGFNDQRILVDASAGNVTITLPAITDAFKNRPPVSIIRIDPDETLFTVTVTGTSSNYQDGINTIMDAYFRRLSIFAGASDWLNDGPGEFERRDVVDKSSTTLQFLGTEPTVDPLIFLSDNGDGTFNVDSPGKGKLVDRANPFIPIMKKFSWAAESNIAVAVPNGIFLVLVDENGVISSQNIDDLASLSINRAPPNLNTHLQIGAISTVGGFVNTIASNIYTDGNIMNRFRSFSQILGTLNSVNKSEGLEPVPGGLTMSLIDGEQFASDQCFQFTNGNSPDTCTFDTTPPAFIIAATRDNVIVDAGFDVNVLEYEDPIGTLITMTNNRSALRFFLSFGDFGGYIFGQQEYLTSLEAIQSTEKAEFPAIALSGAPTIAMAVEKNETDLVNALTTDLPRIF